MKTENILTDDVLATVNGGVTRDMAAAFDVINGKFGNDQARVTALRNAGYDPNVVQGLVNDWLKYGNVARDVMAGKYGVGTDRYGRLAAAGYNANVVQNLVNQFMM
ncbi:MAG: hypothetical protein IJ237_11150 [Oscillospiraceae bacterium]|nr:hypothetical protein [Oscillospiraceae bacterium]